MITFISTKVIMGSKDDLVWSPDDLIDDQLWWWSHLLQVAKTKYLSLTSNSKLVRVVQFAQFKTKCKTNQFWSLWRGVFKYSWNERLWWSQNIALSRSHTAEWLKLEKVLRNQYLFSWITTLKKIVLDHFSNLPILPFSFTFCTTEAHQKQWRSFSRSSSL